MSEPQQRLVPLTADEEAFMRAFGRALLTVPRALDGDLLDGPGMSLSEYTALMHLSEAPDRRLRMSDLAAACAISISGMTRIANRLQERDLLRRERCTADGRAWNAVLTDAGLLRLRQAWPTHLASVRRHILDHLQALDIPALTAALQHFAAETPCPQQHRQPHGQRDQA
jgi:DNA-binding MarR family transcriptional regulator